VKPILLYNGHFIPLTKSTSTVNAVLLDNGLITHVFSKEEQWPQHTKKIDMKGNFVMPGFIDSHTHLVSRGIELQRVDLEKCASLNECLDKLREALRGDSDVVFGSNWDENRWIHGDMRILDKTMLNKLSRKKPIIMRRVCGHYAVVNTRALDCIPKNWKIVNRISGRLYEDIALNLNEIFKPSDEMVEKAVDLACTEALAHGITSIHEITVPHQFRILQNYKEQHTLKLRIALYILHTHFDTIVSRDVPIGTGNDFFIIRGMKIYLDGSIGAKTAAIIKPYQHTHKRGRLLLSMSKVSALVKRAEEQGIQLMIHAIGDRTVHEALKVLNKNMSSRNVLRHRFEHIEMVDSASVEKIAKMNIIASMQPNFVRQWQMPGGLYEHYLGVRYKKMNCFKELLNAGVRVIFGSDCMPLGPLYGIRGAINHPFQCGRLTPLEALRLYTAEGAYATFDEEKKGTIEPGKFADLIVVDKNPLTESNLDNIRVVAVFVNGSPVYGHIS
jgi:predicted amidohydrolase YtcJ